MHKISKRKMIIVFLLIVAMVGAALATSYGVTEEEKKAADIAAKQAKEATQAKRAEAKSAAKKAAQATANFEEAEEKLNSLASEMENTKAVIESTKVQIAETKGKMEQKEKDIEEQNKALDGRLTAMYKTGNTGFVDVILNSDDLQDLMTNVGMVHKILESDQNLLKKLQKDYKELKRLKKELEDQEAALEAREIELEAQQVETEELKKKYKAEADKYKAMEDQLEAEALELAAEAATLQAEAEAMIVEKGGDVKVAKTGFTFPMQSGWKVTSNYGWRICPFHGREFHNGVDLVLNSGTYGAPVYAIADGMITRASWYGGYGNCIQLACGGGYSALYGHLKGYNCKQGQFVKKGTVIGYVGSTGNSTGPHLHFTVFKNGDLTNPMGIY
ncbi:MAG: hypothetical protein E7220_07865 [Clostridiales bacterium]|nr:hypothetical protein [Clostridiales bacterium]